MMTEAMVIDGWRKKRFFSSSGLGLLAVCLRFVEQNGGGNGSGGGFVYLYLGGTPL